MMSTTYSPRMQTVERGICLLRISPFSHVWVKADSAECIALEGVVEGSETGLLLRYSPREKKIIFSMSRRRYRS